MASGHISNNLSQPVAGNGQVTATSAAGGVQVRPAFTNRLKIWMSNSGTYAVTISLGNVAVFGQGIVLTAGQTVSVDSYSGAIYAVTSSTSTTVSFSEV